MIFVPEILALMVVSILMAGYSLYAAGSGMKILAGWDPGSSSEAQLLRERKSCLLSTIVGIVLLANLLCLLFFVNLVDRLHGFFTGAMCAAGTLRVNAYGNPTLLVMIAGCVLCGLWLVINHLESFAPHFSLLRFKYLSLVPVALILGAQAFLLVSYFTRLDPELIASCCGTVFNERGSGMGADLAHLPPGVMEPLFWVTLALIVSIGTVSIITNKLELVYASASAFMLPLGFLAVISFISVRLYELPTHHCPFCLLQSNYGYIGYPLYAGLLAGSTLGIGTGLVNWYGNHCSLRHSASLVSRDLKLWSLGGYALLGIVAARPFVTSQFHL